MCETLASEFLTVFVEHVILSFFIGFLHLAKRIVVASAAAHSQHQRDQENCHPK